MIRATAEIAGPSLATSTGPIARTATTSTAIPLPLYGIIGIACALSYVTANPLLTLGSLLVLLLIIRLLWRPGEPPILAFVCGYQWLQVSMILINGDINGLPVTRISAFPRVELAIWLGLIGVSVLAIGMKISTRRLPIFSATYIDAQLAELSVHRVFVAYLVTACYSILIGHYAWMFLSFTQGLLILASVKWVAYILLGYMTFRLRASKWYFAMATVIEFIAGIGFFAEFKTVFFFATLIFFGIHTRITLRGMLWASGALIGVVIASLAWLSIRDEYRAFLNKGTRQQVVLVSPIEKLSTFGTLIREVDAERMSKAVDVMFVRVAYVDFLAAALDYVPSRRPHEGGNLLEQAIVHVLVPRFLYPDKAVLESDSELTKKYTGLAVASGDEGTSIGLGYVTEAYIDFGYSLMFFPVLLFGMIWGAMYSYFAKHTAFVPIGLGFGTAVLFNASAFEVATVKLLGGMVAYFLVLAVVMRYAVPRVLPLLRERPRKRLAIRQPAAAIT